MNSSSPLTTVLGRNLAIEAVRITEAAAMAASQWIGRGDEKAADQAAVDAMRRALNAMDIDGTIVIGEGERDKAPMLYIGEKVGSGKGPEVDIALDPLEGTTLCAHGAAGSLAVIAMVEKGGFLHAPDVYMDKIAVGPGLPEGVINLDDSPAANIRNVARAKDCEPSDLTVCILQRPRHEALIAAVRSTGACIMLISDGDIAAVMATAEPDSSVDMYMGCGGAPEGVLAAAALSATGGQMMGRLVFHTDEEKARALRMGITDIHRIYQVNDLAHGDVMFAATGVTDGPLLRGVRHKSHRVKTHSIVLRSATKTMRYLDTTHYPKRAQ